MAEKEYSILLKAGVIEVHRLTAKDECRICLAMTSSNWMVGTQTDEIPTTDMGQTRRSTQRCGKGCRACRVIVWLQRSQKINDLTKHVAITYNHIHNLVLEQNRLALQYMPLNENLADICTKACQDGNMRNSGSLKEIMNEARSW